MTKNQPTVRATSIDRRGRAMGVLSDGRVALIDGALPGDFVRLERWFPVGDRLRCASWSTLERSPERQEPVCSAAARCGGCRLMPLNDNAQRKVKLDRVRRALIPVVPEHPDDIDVGWVGAPSSIHYRNRVRMNVNEGRAAFFNPNKSVECPVLEPNLQRMVRWIRDLSIERDELLRPYSHLELRARDSSERPGLLLYPVMSSARHGSLVTLAEEKTTPPGLVIAELEQADRGQTYQITERIQVEVPLQAFLQVNTEVNKALVAHLVDGALTRGSERFLDLYCGAGNLSLPLLSEGLSGTCADRDASAVGALMRSAERLAVDRGRLEATVDDVSSLASRLHGEGRRFDLVVVDPPRTGAGGAPLMSIVAELADRHVAMVACEPETLARDFLVLMERGFVVEQITAFDMFPQTHHVEVVIWLRRPE